MINLLEVLYLIPILLCIFLAYKYLVLRKQGMRMATVLLQAEADKDLLKKQILQTIEDKKLVESEEFMMFLNNSREAAFTYIEEVQAAIAKFNLEVEAILQDDLPSMTAIMKILDANNELQKQLPDNIKNNNVQGEL